MAILSSLLPPSYLNQSKSVLQIKLPTYFLNLSIGASWSLNLIFLSDAIIENPKSKIQNRVDINSPQSPCIPLLDSLKFEGALLVFADSSLPDDVRERLKQKATDVIVKPVPWSELKDKSYFE